MSDDALNLPPELKEILSRLAAGQSVSEVDYVTRLIALDQACCIDHTVPLQIEDLHPLIQRELDRRTLGRLVE